MNLVEKSFSFEPVRHASVLKLLQQLKNPSKSPGIDNLTGKFLRGCPSFTPTDFKNNRKNYP